MKAGVGIGIGMGPRAGPRNGGEEIEHENRKKIRTGDGDAEGKVRVKKTAWGQGSDGGDWHRDPRHR